MMFEPCITFYSKLYILNVQYKYWTQIYPWHGIAQLKIKKSAIWHTICPITRAYILGIYWLSTVYKYSLCKCSFKKKMKGVGTFLSNPSLSIIMDFSKMRGYFGFQDETLLQICKFYFYLGLLVVYKLQWFIFTVWSQLSSSSSCRLSLHLSASLHNKSGGLL